MTVQAGWCMLMFCWFHCAGWLMYIDVLLVSLCRLVDVYWCFVGFTVQAGWCILMFCWFYCAGWLMYIDVLLVSLCRLVDVYWCFVGFTVQAGWCILMFCWFHCAGWLMYIDVLLVSLCRLVDVYWCFVGFTVIGIQYSNNHPRDVAILKSKGQKEFGQRLRYFGSIKLIWWHLAIFFPIKCGRGHLLERECLLERQCLLELIWYLLFGIPKKVSRQLAVYPFINDSHLIKL